MDYIRLCLCVSLVISCLTKTSMSVPKVLDVGLDFDTNPSLEFTSGILEPQDNKDMYDPSILLSRFRRNIAQWYAGKVHYGRDNQNSLSSQRTRPNRNQQTGVAVSE